MYMNASLGCRSTFSYHLEIDHPARHCLPYHSQAFCMGHVHVFAALSLLSRPSRIMHMRYRIATLHGMHGVDYPANAGKQNVRMSVVIYRRANCLSAVIWSAVHESFILPSIHPFIHPSIHSIIHPFFLCAGANCPADQDEEAGGDRAGSAVHNVRFHVPGRPHGHSRAGPQCGHRRPPPPRQNPGKPLQRLSLNCHRSTSQSAMWLWLATCMVARLRIPPMHAVRIHVCYFFLVVLTP